MDPLGRTVLWIGAIIAGIAVTAEGRSAELIQSADRSEDRLTGKGILKFEPDYPFDGPTVSVSSTRDQEIVGFGGAFTEAAALVFHRLPRDEQEKLLDMYFGPSGIGLTIGRVHINSCDFSPKSYSFDDVVDDNDLVHFDTNVTHDTERMIPFIQRAQRLLEEQGKHLKMLAAPWSPPDWMKTNGQMNGSGRPGLKEEMKAVWAMYISKWITAYKSKGIPIWAVTPQNEPENVAPWEACVYTPEQEVNFIAEQLGPTLQTHHPEVQILLYDHNKDHVSDWAEALYANPRASNYTSGVAFHWYSGDSFENIAEVHQKFPQAMLMASEATWERYRWHPGTTMAHGDWEFGMGYAHDIMGDLNAGASGWIDWNLIVDKHGGPNHVDNVCDASMISDDERLYVHPQFYGLGHFSKYIVPGSRRLVSKISNSPHYEGATRPYGVCGDEDGLEATSVIRPDGRIAVVVLNCGQSKIHFKLQEGSEALNTTIPGRAVQTYLLERPRGNFEIVV